MEWWNCGIVIRKKLAPIENVQFNKKLEHKLEMESATDDDSWDDWDDWIEDTSENFEDDKDSVVKDTIRDEVFERMLGQIWKRVDIPGIMSENSLDPLEVIRLTGPVDLQEENSFAKVNLTMSEITLFHLSHVNLQDVIVTRSSNLTEMEIKATLAVDRLFAGGFYSLVGRVWALDWWNVDSEGEQSFTATMHNVTLDIDIFIDTRAGDCDNTGSAVITHLELPLHYDQVIFNATNLDGNLVRIVFDLMIGSLNQAALDALREHMREKISEFMC